MIASTSKSHQVTLGKDTTLLEAAEVSSSVGVNKQSTFLACYAVGPPD